MRFEREHARCGPRGSDEDAARSSCRACPPRRRSTPTSAWSDWRVRGSACIAELLPLGTPAKRVVGIDADAVGAGAAGRNGGFLLAGTADFYHDAIKTVRTRARTPTLPAHCRANRRDGAGLPEAIRRTGSLRIASSEEERVDCAKNISRHCGPTAFPAEPIRGPEGRRPARAHRLRVRSTATLQALPAASRTRARDSSSSRRRSTIESGEVVTTEGRVRCERVVVAVDGRLVDVLPELESRVRAVRLQMLATAPTTEISVPRPVYARWGYDYWQQLEDGRFVLGGFRDIGGDEEWTDVATPSATRSGELESFLREKAPCTRADHPSLGGDGVVLDEAACRCWRKCDRESSRRAHTRDRRTCWARLWARRGASRVRRARRDRATAGRLNPRTTHMAFGTPASRKILLTMVSLVVALDVVGDRDLLRAEDRAAPESGPDGLRCRVDVGYLGHRARVHETHQSDSRRRHWTASSCTPVMRPSTDDFSIRAWRAPCTSRSARDYRSTRGINARRQVKCEIWGVG